MPGLENPLTGLQSSRRNLIRISAIVASAIIVKITPAAAINNNNNNNNDNNGRRHHGSCFVKGTAIRTVDGDRKIEDLAVGDLLPTVFGGICPIQWVARYRFKRSDPTKAWVKNVLPIRVARSALGPDVPHADLYVTEHHAFLIDGVLVDAGNLINSTTITRYDARELDELEFFHIKLEPHDVIFAEGAPCETLLNVDENAANFAEYLREYGPPTTKETIPCAPLLRYGGRRNEIKSCFRSGISQWIDHRQRVDIIRDKLNARGIALLRQSEFIS
jgi:hypothetical protein